MSNNLITLRMEDAEDILKFFEANRKELNCDVTWKPDAPMAEFWEWHSNCEMTLRDAVEKAKAATP